MEIKIWDICLIVMLIFSIFKTYLILFLHHLKPKTVIQNLKRKRKKGLTEDNWLLVG